MILKSLSPPSQLSQSSSKKEKATDGNHCAREEFGIEIFSIIPHNQLSTQWCTGEACYTNDRVHQPYADTGLGTVSAREAEYGRCVEALNPRSREAVEAANEEQRILEWLLLSRDR